MQHFHDIIRIFAALEIFFSMFLLKSGIKSTRFGNSSISLGFSVFDFNFFFNPNQKYFFTFFNFFANGHIGNFVSMLINVVKLDIENNNVVLM